MKPVRPGRPFAALLALAALPAAAFDWTLATPPAVVSVPQWRAPPAGLAVDIAAAASPAGASTRLCAGAFLRTLVRQPGMPDRDSIYRAPLDADTFLVLYILQADGRRTLHGHLLAAAAGTHCIDAHFSRPMAPGEDEDTWRAGFAGAAIRPR